MKEKVTSLKDTARFAGILYFILGIAGYYGIMYIPGKIIVRGDAVATTNNILANEFLFRSGAAVHLVSVITFLFLAFVLYKMFKHINVHQARLLVALIVVQVPLIFLIETCRFTSLMIAKGEILKTFTPAQLQDMSMLFLKVHTYGIQFVEVFWGLWLIPFGQLVYRSGFIPRILGVLLIIAGIGYTVDSFTFILFPDYRTYTNITALTFSGIGELSIILWLLIKGVRSSENRIALQT